MKYRKLRIAWSVGWGVVAVLLCLLWVRSYIKCDLLKCHVTRQHGLSFISQRGYFGITLFDPSDVGLGHQPGLFTMNLSLIAEPYWEIGKGTSSEALMYAIVPSWFVLLLMTTLAAAPWLAFRFSLRTLLIATTLIAVGLGSAVWATK